MFGVIEKYKDRVIREHILPKITWTRGIQRRSRPSAGPKAQGRRP